MKGAGDWTREELMKDYVAEMTPFTVPVNISIHGQQTILDLSSVEEILRNEVITLEGCGCRLKWYKCDAPLDVCLSLNGEAREAMKRGAKRISIAKP